jgi:uncharacterized protein
LSWILQGIAQHAHLSKSVVFKGGTVLKKIYFKDYRFSEDLDFTLLNSEITNELIIKWFKETFEYTLEEANLRLEIIDNKALELERAINDGINFYISYIGPLGGQGNNKKVKVDISRSEKLEFKPIIKPILIEYSDLKEYGLLCYTLEEVLVEKLRTLMQRMQARDFYDIWYLLEVYGMDVSFYIKEFISKCTSKNLKAADFPKKLTERMPQYKGRWQSSMSEQIQNLPDFDSVERETLRHLKTLK